MKYLKPMNRRYFEIKSILNNKDIENIINISKSIGVTQKTVQYSIITYINYIYNSRKKENIVNVLASSILLGCKLANICIKLDFILEKTLFFYKINVDEKELKEIRNEMVKIELQMCIIMDFKFDIVDQYERLKIIVESNNIDKKEVQYIWMFMNDSLYLPLRLCFEIDSIIFGCFYLFHILDCVKQESLEDGYLLSFKSKYPELKINDHEVLFIADELLTLYEIDSKLKNNS